MLTESATDIDAEAAGELEYEANCSNFGARTGAAQETIAVAGLTNATWIAAGQDYSCAANANGQVDCWLG